MTTTSAFTALFIWSGNIANVHYGKQTTNISRLELFLQIYCVAGGRNVVVETFTFYSSFLVVSRR